MVSDPLLSQTIGNYQIVSRLGKGGMATVYRARQLNMQRDVAIKIMSADLAEDPQFVARFEREARVIANLQHPRILPVHDFGHEGEIFYLVMRLIEGESLYHRLLQGPLSLQQASKYLSQIAEALDYAHTQGVVHRDLKPNNVLIDEWDNLYLMDFGLAKVVAASQSLTQRGTVLGTPAYMAPEQWRGEPVDARTDVYSLGVILYEMVIGRTPFEADTPFTLMHKHLNDQPPPPREALPDLPEAVEQVILKALAKTPDERDQSAGDLAREFGEVVRVAGSLIMRERQEDRLADQVEVESQVAERDAPEAADVSITAPPTPGPEPASDTEPEPASDPFPVPMPEDIVPPPSQIVPPPPPIPVGARQPAARPLGEYDIPTGTPGRAGAERDSDAWAEGLPPGVRDLMDRVASSPALRHALDAVDHSLEAAMEKAAQSAPPLGSSRSGRAARTASPGMPVDAPAFEQVRSLLPPDEPLIGVLDARGTVQWQTWKGLLAGGVALFFIGGLLGAGFISFLGIVALFYLGFECFRAWRGDVGRFYLGFTPQRVVLLPRDARSQPRYDRARAAAWSSVTRLRLTNRYALVDMLDDDQLSTRFAALLVAQGEGGLGEQMAWLPGGPIPALIRERGFETRNI